MSSEQYDIDAAGWGLTSHTDDCCCCFCLEAATGMTAEDAQRAYDEAPEVPVSPERIEEIVRYATGKGVPAREAGEPGRREGE